MRGTGALILGLGLVLLSPGCTFTRGASMAQRTLSGRPIQTPGAEAYLVWHDQAGWHLRARSDVARRFHGEIETGPGPGTKVTPVNLEAKRVVTAAGGIAFSFAVENAEAGFDWQGHGCQAFAIYVDGDERPLRVFAGALGASPTTVPFSLCP